MEDILSEMKDVRTVRRIRRGIGVISDCVNGLLLYVRKHLLPKIIFSGNSRGTQAPSKFPGTKSTCQW